MFNSTILFISNTKCHIPDKIRNLFDDTGIVDKRQFPTLCIKTEFDNTFETLTPRQVADGNALRGRTYKLVILDKGVEISEKAMMNIKFAQAMMPDTSLMQLL